MVSITKRSASPVGLIGKPSPFHASVTLFAANTSSVNSNDAPTTDPSIMLRRSKRIKLEKNYDVDDVAIPKLESDGHDGPSPPRKRKARSNVVASSSSVKLEEVSPRRPKPIQQSLAVPHPAPLRWREAYDTIKRMRANIVAPVDTMGCDQAQLKEVDPKSQRFSTLVSLMLSSQTRDEVTDAAVGRLREGLGGSITVDAVLAADDTTISEAIAKVGFWRRKTQYIKQTAKRLRDDFDSDVPRTVDELCSLPGVGPKMAFLALQVAWKINVGIGVDVHVHRITNRLGWHKPPTKTPEETRLNLQSWLPTELHPEINHLLVGFGQTICLPVGPRCDECELSSGLCPSARKITKTAKIRKIAATSTTKGGPKVEITLEEQTEEKLFEPLADAPSPLSDIE
ncbi:unnamed protein product [Somion occarium]|uniref:Endonuclease III homolog n=2 Tax=Somion occarium TaxID=3059160 RepID=A0ABP1D5Y8_9APHY